MASFHTVRLALFDGRSTAFKKFNANSGYKAQGTRPNKVSMPSLSFFGIFPVGTSIVFIMSFPDHSLLV